MDSPPGHLAKPEDEDTQSFLQGFAQTTEHPYPYWIGASYGYNYYWAHCKLLKKTGYLHFVCILY